MSYSPYYQNGWKNGSVGGTPVTAEALNHMDDGIADNAAAITEIENTLNTLPVSKGGTGATTATDALNNLGAVKKSGDEMTGTLVIKGGALYRKKSDTIDATTDPMSDLYNYALYFADKNNLNLGQIDIAQYRNGQIAMRLLLYNYDNNGTRSIVDGLYIYANRAGNISYRIPNPENFRSALGLGASSGALPVANGGTGQTSLQATRNAMGLGNTTGALPPANGGTGQTSLQATRNAMGLGNTTGALPPANGGTGQTSLQATRNAMGLGNTTGALPVANGGTGSTVKGVSGALNALGIHVLTTTLSFGENGKAVYNFPSNVHLLQAIPVATQIAFHFYRSAGFTQYTFFQHDGGFIFSENVSVDLIYMDK